MRCVLLTDNWCIVAIQIAVHDCVFAIRTPIAMVASSANCLAGAGHSVHLSSQFPPALSSPSPQLQFSRQPSVSARGTAVVVDGASLLITPLRHTGK